MTIKNTNTLDTKKKYRATVTDHPEYGNWILSHDGHTWNATKPGGSVLASAHWWNIEGALC